MKINKFFIKEEISVRALNTCIEYEIETISDLKECFITHGSFKHFRKCGSKTNHELIEICLKYFDYSNENRKDGISNDMIVQVLSKFNKRQIDTINNIINSSFSKLSNISSKAISNYLSNSVTIDGFLNHILKNKYFDIIFINDADETTFIELSAFINYIKNNIIKLHNIPEESDFKNIVTALNNSQRQIVDDFIIKLSKKLSTRSYNAICKNINSKPNIILLTEKIHLKDFFDTNGIQNIGKRSMYELNNYFEEIKRISIEIFEIKNESELDQFRNKIFQESFI